MFFIAATCFLKFLKKQNRKPFALIRLVAINIAVHYHTKNTIHHVEKVFEQIHRNKMYESLYQAFYRSLKAVDILCILF